MAASSGFTRHGQLRDRQRRKVYRFEHTYNTYEEQLDLEECQKFVDFLLTRHTINAPTQKIRVTPGKSGRGAAYYYREQKMVLNKKCRTYLVICHEFAHAMLGLNNVHEPHGPHFVTTMLQLQLEYAYLEATRPWTEILVEAQELGYKP